MSYSVYFSHPRASVLFPFLRPVLLGKPQFRYYAKAYPSSNPRRGIGKLLHLVVAVLGISVSFLAAVAIFGPTLYYQFVPADTVPIEARAAESPFGGSFDQTDETTALEEIDQLYVPPQQASLPEGEWLIIPRIGVHTQLQRVPDADEAMKTGVWAVPDFGRVGDDLPVILAAHAFPYTWMFTNDYWRYHTFNQLTELEPGDTIEIIDDQRKWVYEIYSGEEGTEITDYDADIILYTCKFLNSPVRHFRYARLIDPTVDTQRF